MRRMYSLNPFVEGVQASTIYTPQLTNHWELDIRLPRDLNGGTNASAIDKLRRYLNLAITGFQLPTISTTPVDIPYGNTTLHFAGKTEFGGSQTITVIDYIGADIERILYNQQMLVTNPETGQMGWAPSYKTDATCILYSPDGYCLSGWLLRGFWFNSINYGTLQKQSADVRTIECTISYDVAYKKFDESTGREAAGLENDDPNNPNMISSANMAWKSQSKYEQTNKGGPLNQIPGGGLWTDGIV